MEVKKWTYEEFPEFCEEVPSATWLDTTGDEAGVMYLRDVEYEVIDGASRVLQILVPFSRNAKPPAAGGTAELRRPCVVYVQGSAWMTQEVYFNLGMLARLAARGYVVALVQYRESSLAHFPAPVRDARNAVRFMRSNAQEYGIDCDRVALMGDSSGGHTVVYAGILHDDDTAANLFSGVSAEVRCIVNYYGSTDFTFEGCNPTTEEFGTMGSPESMEMGEPVTHNNDACRTLTVRCNIDESTQIAPVLTFHGTKDRTVHTRCSVLLHQRLVETGHDSTLYLLRGADHGGSEFWSDEVLGIVDAFLQEHLA